MLFSQKRFILRHALGLTAHVESQFLFTFHKHPKPFTMRVQTEAIHFTADVKLLDNIQKKLSKLEHLFGKVTDAKIILKLENSGQVRDKIAEIKLSLPNGIIFIKESAKTFEAAIDAVVACLKRQLVKYKEKIQQKK
ncbi:MAG: hypothetical protein RIS64_2730 [Bacteroidota bacterium]